MGIIDLAGAETLIADVREFNQRVTAHSERILDRRTARGHLIRESATLGAEAVEIVERFKRLIATR